jgi:hypothetical protein
VIGAPKPSKTERGARVARCVAFSRSLCCLFFPVQQRGPRNVPSSEFVLEEGDIYFVSEIHIERYEAARRWDEIKSNHINTGSDRARPACCS